MSHHTAVIWQNWHHLNNIMEGNYSKIILLTDTVVIKHCLGYFREKFRRNIDHVITIEAGEENKSMMSAASIWQELNLCKADRKSLLICLGGGMICDLGGFAASVYKRGIKTMYVPTTLLAMTDASIGGKTALDFEGIKNLIGSFHLPDSIFIDTHFLATLPAIEWLNGYAEIIKHAIIADAELWDLLHHLHFKLTIISDDILTRSINIKQSIVAVDPFEQTERKKLNFGHTAGHALEAYFFNKEKTLSHGQAVAAGMIIESYINMCSGKLSEKTYEQIRDFILKYFPAIGFKNEEIADVAELCKHDKKREFGTLTITKIIAIGLSEPDLIITEQQLKEGLEAYIRATS